LVEAIDGDYLLSLRNRSTNAITVHLHEVLTFLFLAYCKVTSTMLDDHETKAKQMTYDPQHPVDIVFNAIEDLHDLSHAANSVYTQQQLINMGHNKFLKTGTFKSAIRDWNKRPQVERTWVNFKAQFRQAQQELKETNGLEVGNAGFDQANLVKQVVDRFQAVMSPSKEENSMADDYMSSVANLATSQKELFPTLLQQMKEIQDMMQKMQQQMETPTNRHRRQITRRNKSKYCWSHGACSHTSSTCNNKIDGHKDEATFDNKLGGSIYYCN
jgi:hypothetical protein